MARLPATKPTIYNWTKKEPCCWCINSESCDIEESECMIQLRNGERTRLATAATSCIDASWQNQTADSSISLGASPRWFFFFFCPGQYMYKTYLCSLQSLNIWAIFNPGAIQTTVVVHWANKKFLTKVDIFTLYLWNAFTKPKLLFHAKIQSLTTATTTNDIHITTTIPVPYKKVKETKKLKKNSQ